MSPQLFSATSVARQRLIRLMQGINFGRIEQLVVRDGEPVFSPLPRVFRTIKLSGANDCRPEASACDFALKREIIDLLEQLDAAGDAVIPLIDIRHGLPLLMELEDASLV